MAKIKLKKAQKELDKIIKETNKNIDNLSLESKELSDVLEEIQLVFDQIRGLSDEKRKFYREIKHKYFAWKELVKQIEDEVDKFEIKVPGMGAVGAGMGVTTVTMGPRIAMGIATTYGVASTGTAISSLSGAVAERAALAWLGGGALSAGGGGVAAGEGFLLMLGPAGWIVTGVSLVASGVLFYVGNKDKKRVKRIFYDICKRETKRYNLAIIEMNEKKEEIIIQKNGLNNAIEMIKDYGFDYNKMTEEQQYNLGKWFNLMSSSVQLLERKIENLKEFYTDVDFRDYIKNVNPKIEEDEKDILYYKQAIIVLSNMLHNILLDETDKKIMFKILRKNKKFIKSLKIKKKEFKKNILSLSLNAIDYKNNN